jgi:IS30 family transposase
LTRQDWSPEQITGRVKLEQGIRTSHEIICQCIYGDKRSGNDLYQRLRRQKRRHKRYGHYDRRGVTPNHVPIDEHPAIVDAGRRLGDWEGNIVIGKGRCRALVVLVEPKSSHTVIGAIYRNTAKAARTAVAAESHGAQWPSLRINLVFLRA